MKQPGLTARLPIENPVCKHEWERYVDRFAFVCRECGYVLTEYELSQRHEGEVDDSFEHRREA